MESRQGYTLMENFNDKLDTIDFDPDTDYAHVEVIATAVCHNCREKTCCSVCPTGVFYVDERGDTQADYCRCVECGACVLVCSPENIRLDYPHDGHGVLFHHG